MTTKDGIDAIAVGQIAADQLDAAIHVGLRARLHLPYERPPAALTANTRAHWRRRSADTRQVRETVLTIAKQAGLHRITGIQHVTVELVWAPGDRRTRDADNVYPLLKACCDALARGPRRDWVGLELVPTDTPEHMTKLAPRIEPPPAPKGMWLDLELSIADVPDASGVA